MRPSRSPAYALSGLTSATRSHTYTFTAASTFSAVPAVAASDRAANENSATFRVMRDTAPPQVWLDAPRRVYAASIPVTWGATDDASGVACYDLDARVEDGEWQQLLTRTASTSYEFTDISGSYFAFRVTATDNVGNQASAETSAHVARVTKYYYLGGRRVAMRVGGVVYYLHGDHLGSVSLATDADGGFHSRQLFLPYGDTRWQEGTLPTDFGFGGQRHDGSTGLVFMHARYYHAGLGRFVSADTIVPNPGNPQDLNRYTYARNSPMLYADPSGHNPILGLMLIAAGVAALAVEIPQISSYAERNDMSFWEAAADPDLYLDQAAMADAAVKAAFATLVAAESVPLVLAGGGAMLAEYGLRTGDVGAWEAAGTLNNAAAGVEAWLWRAGAPAESAVGPTNPYNRVQDYGYSPTAAQRRQVNQPGNVCVDCGMSVEELQAQGIRMVADHNPPLLMHYYEYEGYAMTQGERLACARGLESIQPQCPSCSASQGGHMSHLSRLYRKFFELE